MNLRVDPKPYDSIDHFNGTLRGTLITTHEPPLADFRFGALVVLSLALGFTV